GGAMDIAVGARQVWVATTHTTDAGEPKIVDECTYPLTAARCVRRIYTDLAVLRIEGEDLVVEELAPGVTLAELVTRTGARLSVPPTIRTMDIPKSVADTMLVVP
ncbi:MAG: succinyl-CoA--3-ketoacid-CoA transferase, partial [Thermomicrobium sp.]|nr:succinyl-CoA--3-ketoacid-CoA transferase [Thermomicrobium sp.]